MIYTDSTKIKAILTAPKYLDYTNLSFQYSTFPKGLKVDFFEFWRLNIMYINLGEEAEQPAAI